MTAIYIKQRLAELDDMRIVGLSASAFRALALLRLLAGILDKGGELPTVTEIAFRLRSSPGLLAADLDELGSTGLVERSGPGWRLTTFEDEQAPASSKERTRAWRERHGLSVTPASQLPLACDETSHSVTLVSQAVAQEQAQEQDKDQGKTRQGETSHSVTLASQAAAARSLMHLGIEAELA